MEHKSGDQILVALLAAALGVAALFTWLTWQKVPAQSSGMIVMDGFGPWQESGPAIGVLRLEGVIMDTSMHVRQIKEWRKDDSIKGLLLVIDSPGGAVAPSQLMYDAVMAFREDKPVAAAMGSVAASGGYYVAAAAHTIHAVRGTLTGSIGVIMESMDLQGLADKTGIRARVIKSGKHKDMGSPFRSMTSEETSLLQGVIDDTYDQFIEDVLRGRSRMDRDKLLALADGRIMTGRQAVLAGLVDGLGGYATALSTVAGTAGLDQQNTPIRYPSRRWEHRLEDIFNSLGAAASVAGRIVGITDQLPGRAGADSLRPGLWLLWPGATR